jgi:tRNA modification GTPase
MHTDTIAAIATPPGESGLAIVRLSGSRSIEIAEACFAPARAADGRLREADSHTLHYGRILRHEKVVDEALVAVMRAPRTFTREDVVEITCHGGTLPAKSVLNAILEKGARLAEPGEFTRRAFLNGRIDLVQAEAVADLIHSRTELALRAANEQLAGKLSQRLHRLRDDLMKALAHIEAHIDFPDEDIAPDTREQLMSKLDGSISAIDQLLKTADEGQILRRGVRAAIVGRPNAGKSSLLNQLLGRDRAIVSPVPGTTRDTIEETANIRGLPVVFIDTAGLRDSGDEIEQEGVRRSRQTVEKAELLLHVLDASEPLTPADTIYLKEFAGRRRVLVLNKCDLPRQVDFSPEHTPQTQSRTSVIETSCLTGAGVEDLKSALKELVWSGEIRTETLEVMINSRHQNVLQRARSALMRSREAMHAGSSLELIALDLRAGVDAIGEVVGKTATEDLLDMIFSQFCIGK